MADRNRPSLSPDLRPRHASKEEEGITAHAFASPLRGIHDVEVSADGDAKNLNTRSGHFGKLQISSDAAPPQFHRESGFGTASDNPTGTFFEAC